MMPKVMKIIQFRINPSKEQKKIIDETMQQFADMSNYASEYMFEHNLSSALKAHHGLYKPMREKFQARSRLTENAMRRVAGAYRAARALTHLKRPLKFTKPYYEMVYKNDYILHEDTFLMDSVVGRIKVPFFTKWVSKYLDKTKYHLGAARVCKKHGKYILYVTVKELEEAPDYSTARPQIVGIDRGINFLVTTYDGNGKTAFVSGRSMRQKRIHYKKLRRELQKRGTYSAMRRLRAIGHRENRWMHDVNHCISKALVTKYPAGTLFVLENLSGIRQNVKGTKRHTYDVNTWAFFQFEQMLTYKAHDIGSQVVKVSARFTSQRCPICGYTDRANRDKAIHLFACHKCGYRSNDDRIAAMNLYQRGVELLSGEMMKLDEILGTDDEYLENIIDEYLEDAA